MRAHPLALETRGLLRTALLPLVVAFRASVALRALAYRRGWLRVRRLNCPVISVGNLSVGGTGKTPFVVFLAETLLRLGWKPSILSRGYGRRSGEGPIALEPGAGRAPDPRVVGDEPALLARRLPEVPLVIAADRYRAGLMAEERFGVNVHLLDDGFQHLALARELDIVLLDLTRNYSTAALLPAGSLREPLAALARAQIVVLTRAELADPLPLENELRRLNPDLKIFRSRTRLEKFVDAASGNVLAMASVVGKPVCAFCGIGNPSAFFGDLRKWGLAPVVERVFPDHHPYSEQELGALSRQATEIGAATLLTTEKDVMNFPRGWRSDFPVLACVVEVEVEPSTAFVEALAGRLEGTRPRP
jgi:tetraacyldisaccharide 4'-kinase